jgi:ABC-type cobalamin/Fe3+-siderophores transport system ATPase subunit
MIEAESLFVSYGSRIVLKNISFTLPAGCVLGIVGPNGSGKSTLIRALSGVLPLQSGCIWVQGQDLTKMAPAGRARKIAVVPQAINLPPAFTAWETVLLGRTPHLNWLGQVSERDEAIARQAMLKTSTFDLIDRRVSELSGGEQQRLLLARALAQSASILLMDEPTAHLDLRHQLSLLEQVHQLAHQENMAVLMVLHDLNLVARFADQVALLVDGSLQEPGCPEEIFTAERLSRIYQVPLQTVTLGRDNYTVILPAAR